MSRSGLFCRDVPVVGVSLLLVVCENLRHFLQNCLFFYFLGKLLEERAPLSALAFKPAFLASFCFVIADAQKQDS